MGKTYAAQMSQRYGRWRVYVALLNTTEPWPEYTFPPDVPVPTPAQRAEALQELGFTPVMGRQWDWVEASKVPDDPASPVELIAATEVEEVA